MEITLEEGKRLVELARSSVESYVLNRELPRIDSPPPGLSERRGVFVTLKKREDGEERLRGCVGFPYPLKPLIEAVMEAAVAAASEDPRFQPVSRDELQGLTFEVSVLTEPVEVKVAKKTQIPSKIEIGRDGLIVSNGLTSGLLLPQVAVEYSLAPDEFLSEACIKAGLLPDAWLEEGVTVYTFRAEVFSEREPGGEVERALA